jgi:peptidoglycan biosynthesis protein MviN/MurJ (putative lipid II flippase)
MASTTDWHGVRVGVTLSLLTAGQLFTSFAMQWYTIAKLGVGSETDALYAGSTLLQLFSAVVMDQLSFVLVPLLAAREERERSLLAWPLFLGIGSLFVVVTGLLYAAAPHLVPLTVPGFSGATAVLAIELSRIQLIGLLGAAGFTVLSALYQARNRFLWVGVSVLVCSLLSAWMLVAGLPQLGVRWAAWVQVFLWCGPALLLLRGLGAWSPLSAGHHVLFRDLWFRVRPLLVSAACVRSGFVVDRFLTSFLASGSLVLLDLTWRVLAAVVRIVNQGLVTPAVPTLAALARGGQWREFSRLYHRRLWWMGGACGAAYVLLLGAVTLGRVFGDGLPVAGLSGEAFATIQAILLAGAGMLLFGGLNFLMVNAFYAEGETALPAKIEIGTSLAGFVFKAIGFLLGGLIGIAVGTSVHYALSSLLLGLFHHRRLASRLRDGSSSPVQGLLAVGTPGHSS